MATASRTGTHRKPRSSTATRKSAPADAIDQLIDDHEAVNELFERYDRLMEKGTARQKATLAAKICTELKVHTQVEEALFYPAARAALEDEGDLFDEAVVEHASAKSLIAQIEAGSPEEALYDAKVVVLGEYIRHHVKEEEEEMFPKVRKTRLDLDALGKDMRALRRTVQAELKAEPRTPARPAASRRGQATH